MWYCTTWPRWGYAGLLVGLGEQYFHEMMKKSSTTLGCTACCPRLSQTSHLDCRVMWWRSAVLVPEGKCPVAREPLYIVTCRTRTGTYNSPSANVAHLRPLLAGLPSSLSSSCRRSTRWFTTVAGRAWILDSLWDRSVAQTSKCQLGCWEEGLNDSMNP